MSISNEKIDFFKNHNCSALLRNTDNSSMYQFLWQTVSIVIYIIIYSIGTIGNLLVIFVILLNTKLKTVTNMYLLHLAITDIIYLQCIPFTLISLIKRKWIFNIAICKIFYIFTGINQFTSIFILIVLAFDRYLAVCQPVLAISWRKLASSRIILAAVWIISVLFMMPLVLFSDVEKFDDNLTNNTSCEVLDIQSGQTCTIKWPENSIIPTEIAYSLYGVIISFLIPVVLITIFYICVVKRLKDIQFRLKHQSSERDRARRKVTTLVLSVISIYILLYTPFWINQIVLNVYYTFNKSNLTETFHHFVSMISTIFQIMLCLNSALNPYLYAFLSEVFRESFKKVFQCYYNPLLRHLKTNNTINKNEAYFFNMNNKSRLNEHSPSMNDENTILRRLSRLQSIYNPSFSQLSIKNGNNVILLNNNRICEQNNNFAENEKFLSTNSLKINKNNDNASINRSQNLVESDNNINLIVDIRRGNLDVVKYQSCSIFLSNDNDNINVGKKETNKINL